jgi:Rrf2 family protein
MRINAKSDYALRGLLELMLAEDEVVSGEDIAAAQGIPVRFLGNILIDLRKAGIVTSHRGAQGGYSLARPPREITVADVIRAVDGPLASVQGVRPQDTQYDGAAQVLQPLWVAVRASLRDVLETVTLAHLVEGHLPRKVSKLVEDADAWVDR